MECMDECSLENQRLNHNLDRVDDVTGRENKISQYF